MSSHFPSLSPVAAEYLRHHDEIETARELFRGERKAILDAFKGRMIEAAREFGQPVAATKYSGGEAWIDATINGRYSKVRLEGGNKRSAGYSVALDTFQGGTGVHALLWFHLKLTAPRKTRLDVDGLAQKLAATAHPESTWLYLRTAWQPADALDLTAFGDEVARLPELFGTADAWIAERWVG